jgi:hypothetical protein
LTLLSGLALVWLITRGDSSLKAHLLKAAPKETATILQPKQWASAAWKACGTRRQTQESGRLQISGLAVVRTFTLASGSHVLWSSSSVAKVLSQVAADAHAASRLSANLAFLAPGRVAAAIPPSERPRPRRKRARGHAGGRAKR